jgi:hypothetical protein
LPVRGPQGRLAGRVAFRDLLARATGVGYVERSKGSSRTGHRVDRLGDHDQRSLVRGQCVVSIGRGPHDRFLGKGEGLGLQNTFSLLGIDALPVEVEVDVSPNGLPKMVLVGLPEAAVKESTHRVERAIVNSGFQRPQSRVVINLAPACSRLSQWEDSAYPRRLARSPATCSTSSSLDEGADVSVPGKAHE